MKWFPSTALLLGSQLLAAITILAAPIPASNQGPSSAVVGVKRAAALAERFRGGHSASHLSPGIIRGNSKHHQAAAPAAPTEVAAEAPAGEAEAAGEVENNVDGAFDEAIALGGGDIKTDVLFTKSAVGSLEIEFQNAEGRTLTVTENKTPGSPPAGFVAIEPSSFQVNLAEGADGLTLQKVDYIFDVTNPAIAALDLSQGQIGKLCTETNTFVIDPVIGELEFEDDENELTLTVQNINGEWGIFIPETANAAAPPAEGETAAGETEVEGAFDTAIAVPGGNAKTDILFTEGVTGKLEVEYDGAAENVVLVSQNANPVAAPAGFLFVDPTTFQVQTQSATDPATDTVKIDYIFTPDLRRVVDVTQGIIGKLDAATNTFVIEGLGEFEFEDDENEWTLTVPDLNGEWAVFIPETALLVGA
ncbi:hypothetical protein AJ80_02545 [Polytolypa hystricis UAMH7299]|uniref:Accumulation-associated protein n=1 Tax=Polytolypa hystricis (strain UAMH7299) TaxID=1447883 RepID=A0A2B7YQ64_POLH7|nr:hypothetical protein AJ80_02545 [Polytolypa hystricis UAMH7299]